MKDHNEPMRTNPSKIHFVFDGILGHALSWHGEYITKYFNANNFLFTFCRLIYARHRARARVWRDNHERDISSRPRGSSHMLSTKPGQIQGKQKKIWTHGHKCMQRPYPYTHTKTNFLDFSCLTWKITYKSNAVYTCIERPAWTASEARRSEHLCIRRQRTFLPSAQFYCRRCKKCTLSCAFDTKLFYHFVFLPG